MVVCVGSEQLAIFSLPQKDSASSQVKQCDCRVSLHKDGSQNAQNLQMQILACHVSSDANSSGKKEQVFATVVYGNLYKIEKKRVSLG